MKQMSHNRFVKVLRFSNSAEETKFLESCMIDRKLSISDSDGQSFLGFVVCNALTQEEEFVLTFRSDFDENCLNLAVFNDRFIFDTGKKVYFLDFELSIIESVDITGPLIGIYSISNSELLIMEETFFRVTNLDGNLIRSESFDLVTKVELDGTKLHLQTDSGERIFSLS